MPDHNIAGLDGMYIYKNQLFGMQLENKYSFEIGFGPKNLCSNFTFGGNESIPLTSRVYRGRDAEMTIYKGDADITDEFFKTHMSGQNNANMSPVLIAQAISILLLVSQCP